MSDLRIKEITISVQFADKDYGKGTESFHCLKADYPNPLPFTEINSVVDDSLDLFFAAWKTMLGTRFATGVIKAEEFKIALQNTQLRLDMVRKHLRKGVVEA
jgi:hypothetical protein